MTERLGPIFVASKGRPYSSTLQRLQIENIPVTVVVEPQDALAYEQAGWKDIAVLPTNDQGLPFVRQWILTQAPPGWWWMLDDDILNFYAVRNQRTVTCTALVALTRAQAIFTTMPDVAQAGLEYQQFAWSAPRAYRLNAYCDVCVAIHTERVRGLRFRPETGVKVDRDFTLQALAAGYRTCLITRYAFATPANGSNAGGLAAEYARGGAEAAASQTMVRLWPGICTPVTKSDGRPDVKIDWRYFQRTAVRVP